MYFVYMIKCKDGSYYTGFTNNFDRRLREHLSGNGAKYFRSKQHQILEATFLEVTFSIKVAMREERKIKKLTHKEKAKIFKGGLSTSQIVWKEPTFINVGGVLL